MRVHPRYHSAFLFALALLCSSFSALAEDDPTAKQIMEKVDALDDGDNRVSDMEMILIDRHGNERVRKIRSMRKDKNEDTLSIMFFLEPADVVNTGFLVYDYDDSDKDDDQWLYLPALRKSKRIPNNNKSDSFMGSDFTYSDITSRDIEDYNYQLKKEILVEGHKTWVIESIPKNKKIIEETGYTKSIAFIRKDNYVVIRAISWVKEGKKQKYMAVNKLEKIDGIWTPTEIQMTTKRAGETQHKTILKFHNVKYNQNLNESIFSVRRLAKGL
ncbi:MAG: outer membrane lipoprotein-sorting protein [Gammaproteobacteria bacterium]|nr:outer membrane lipoprotein-sorting protein [Gammaproteobacteria bacterium]